MKTVGHLGINYPCKELWDICVPKIDGYVSSVHSCI